MKGFRYWLSRKNKKGLTNAETLAAYFYGSLFAFGLLVIIIPSFLWYVEKVALAVGLK